MGSSEAAIEEKTEVDLIVGELDRSQADSRAG